MINAPYFRSMLCVLACALTAVSASADTARSAMRTGAELMAEDDFVAAAAKFVEAAELAPGQKIEAAPAWFNAANAMFRAGEYEQATDYYHRALDSDDVELQSRIYHGLGNIDLEQARAALDADREAVAALSAYERALENYERAIVLDPEYTDPKFNYELTQLRIARLFGFVGSLQADLSRARDMARDREYTRAAELLHINMENHKLAFQLEPDLEERYQELLQRNSELAEIIQRLEGSADVF